MQANTTDVGCADIHPVTIREMHVMKLSLEFITKGIELKACQNLPNI